MRRQGRLRSTLRPSRHRQSTIASSITLLSCSSTAGSKGRPCQCQSSAVAPPQGNPVGAGQLGTAMGRDRAIASLQGCRPHTLFGPPGSRSSSCYRLSWLRPRCSRRRSNGCSRPARLW
eukprot:scaffold53036_cov63-Phaeocystis_antarctica.AAC.4